MAFQPGGILDNGYGISARDMAFRPGSSERSVGGSENGGGEGDGEQ